MLNKRMGQLAVVAVAAALLGGCATSGNPKDPMENFNRSMYKVHDGIDTVVMKPLATGYAAVLPDPIQTGVTNFFSNIADLPIALNNLLQGKPDEAIGDLGRFLINSTVGVFGILDIATPAGIEKNTEDVGQTLGRWGVDSGAYVFIPVFGPRTVRDTAGLALDLMIDPITHIDHVPTRNTALGVRAINYRAELLPADKVIEEAAIDKYAYIRDAYLQRRQNLVYDGNPPRAAE
jgi:phospholipid-binding lipoprotein MlaA